MMKTARHYEYENSSYAAKGSDFVVVHKPIVLEAVANVNYASGVKE